MQDWMVGAPAGGGAATSKAACLSNVHRRNLCSKSRCSAPVVMFVQVPGNQTPSLQIFLEAAVPGLCHPQKAHFIW